MIAIAVVIAVLLLIIVGIALRHYSYHVYDC